MTMPRPMLVGKSQAPGTAARVSLIGRIIDAIFPALQSGRLQLILPNCEVIERRGSGPGADAMLRVHRWQALWRILHEGEDGLANGYIDGNWSTPSLPQLFELGLRNEQAVSSRTKKWFLSLTRNRLKHMLRANTRRGSQRNIMVHYDLGNAFFSAWLDQGMSYSSALYQGAQSLEQAQLQKLDRIAELLALRGGERILEIGCGWGALAERLIGRFGATVSAVTLSREQLRFARSRLAREMEKGCAEVRLLDYRDVEGRFDRVVSIEMVEAVGERYWPAYFSKLRASLRDGGLAVLQAITIAENRFAAYRKRPDFIQRHIFPGGMLPTRSIIEHQASRARLKLVHHESFGDSYAATLREWRNRFVAAGPRLDRLGFDEKFRRLWEYYLAYCEVGFGQGVLNVGLYVFET